MNKKTKLLLGLGFASIVAVSVPVSILLTSCAENTNNSTNSNNSTPPTTQKPSQPTPESTPTPPTLTPLKYKQAQDLIDLLKGPGTNSIDPDGLTTVEAAQAEFNKQEWKDKIEKALNITTKIKTITPTKMELIIKLEAPIFSNSSESIGEDYTVIANADTISVKNSHGRPVYDDGTV